MNLPSGMTHAPQKKSRLASAFPVPRSLILSDIAIDVSDGIIRHFQFAHSRGNVTPKSYGAKPFPRIRVGALDERSRAEAVAALKAWAAETKATKVHVVVHEDEAYVFKVTVPTAEPKEIKPAIEALLEENVPIPPAEAVIEYDIIARDEKLRETTVAVSVLSEKSLYGYINLFQAAGLEAVSLETETRALCRTLFKKGDPEVHAVLAIAERHSVMFIAERGTVAFASSIEVGSRDLDKAIAKTLNISPEAARAQKRDRAFTASGDDMQLFEAMLPVMSTIRDELSKILVFWRTEGKKERDFKDVSDIVLVGSDALISGFARYIALVSKTPTKIGSVWTNVLSPETSLPDLPHEDSLDYGSVIGTLL